MYANKGITLSQTLKYNKGVGTGYFYIALSYDIDNQLDSGIYYYKKSLDIYKAIKAYKSCAITLSNLGELYFKKGNIDEAYKSYTESIPFFENINAREGIARTYFNIGIIFKLNGNYQTGTEYFFRALTISESIHDTIKIALTYQEIGNIYLRQKNFDKTKYYYEKALQTITSSHSNYLLNITAGLKSNLGKANEESGAYDQAFDNYNNALALYEKIANKAGIAKTLLNIGELFNKQKQYQKALAYNTKSQAVAESLNDPYINAFTVYNQGSIYRGLKQYDKSLKLFQEALKKAKDIKDKNLTKSIVEELSLTYEATGNYKNAYIHYKQYKTLNDSLYNDEVTRRITTNELQYEFDKKQKAIAFVQQQKEMLLDAKLKKQRLIVKVIIILSFLLILLLFTGFGYYRSRQLAKFRTLEIELNRTIQQALSQQMNPHFIFNCLNSIKALIIENKTEETEKYFTIFANLMRRNLEYSQHPAISINDEIEALQLYVKLEQLRFKNKFTFATEIDPEIDQYTCKIPSLLLQPFVENAIIHGFKNKDKGAVMVSMTLKENEILCSIEDNGSGRKLENENTKSGKHKSYGTILTKKRLELINQLYGDAKELNIIDKKDSTGNPAGTCIEFGIPIII
jgi:tetratricopeptide (TPR) repeat protein